MANISAKQQKVLDFLRQYTKENGYSPSVRDICEGLGFSSTSTVHGYLCRLEERGLIRQERSSRGVCIFLTPGPEKVDLNSSAIILRLRRQGEV